MSSQIDEADPSNKLLIVYYGTGGIIGDHPWNNTAGTNLDLLQKYTHLHGRQKSFGIRGVGTRRQMKRYPVGEMTSLTENPALASYVTAAARLWPKPFDLVAKGLHKVADLVATRLDKIEQGFASEILNLVVEGLKHTQNAYSYEDYVDSTNVHPESADPHVQIFLLGMSRGGFEAQVAAAFLDIFGIGRDRDWFEIKQRELGKFQSRNGGLLPAAPDRVVAPIRGLFALDPVATRGWRSAFKQPAPEISGLSTRTVPSNVEPANVSVVLAAGEDRLPYRPNPYADHPQEQMWFAGTHGDTVGKSRLALPILAYLYERMSDLGLVFEDHGLRNELHAIYHPPQHAGPPPPLSCPKVHFSNPIFRRARQCEPAKVHWTYNPRQQNPHGFRPPVPNNVQVNVFNDRQQPEQQRRHDWGV